MNDKLTDAEMTMLLDAVTDQQWGEACDAVKAARGGTYPADWYDRVIKTGLMHATIRMIRRG